MKILRTALIFSMSIVGTAQLRAQKADYTNDVQVRSGTLVVLIVSQRADYVVIAAESRNVDQYGNRLNDNSCKIISLGGEILFYEAGNSSASIVGGSSWNSQGAARAVYKYSQERNALNLSNAWRARALNWFSRLEEKNFLAITEPPKRMLVTEGFIAADTSDVLSVQGAVLSYDDTQHKLLAQLYSYGSGAMVALGVATDLVNKFSAGKMRGFDSASDVNLAQQAIKFAMNNAVGKYKETLGGDIDIAILRSNRTIKWVARKPSCSKEDLKPAAPAKHK